MNKEYKGYQNKGQYKRALKKSGPMLGIKESKPKKYKRPKKHENNKHGKGPDGPNWQSKLRHILEQKISSGSLRGAPTKVSAPRICLRHAKRKRKPITKT